jgi:hypothetical protein
MKKDWVADDYEPIPVIGTWSVDGIGAGAFALGFSWSVLGHAAWPADNLAKFYPFRLTKRAILRAMIEYNGNPSGNIDLGVYNEQGNRLGSTGSIAMVGAFNMQAPNLAAPVVLGPGVYYFAMAASDAAFPAATFQQYTSFVDGPSSLGCCEMAGAFPLPAVAVFAHCAWAGIPIFGGCFGPRTVF